MALLMLQAQKAAPGFPKMKLIYVLRQARDSRSYQRKFVQLRNKSSKLVEKLLLKYTHFCAVVSYYALILLFLAFNLQNLQVSVALNFVTTMIQVSPLLLFVKGLHALHFRSMIWMCFLSLIYFIHGAMNAFSDTYWIFGWGEIICTVCMFTSLTFRISAEKKRPKSSAQKFFYKSITFFISGIVIFRFSICDASSRIFKKSISS